MRKFIFILILFLGAAYVYLSFGELEIILATLRKGEVRFIVFAILIQFCWFVVTGMTYASLYQILGMQGTTYRLMLMSAAVNFVNIVAPSAGMGGMAVFISEAKRNKQSPGKATVVSMLFIILDYTAFLIVLMFGLIVLFRRNDLTGTEVAASFVMLAIAAGLSSMLVLGSRSADTLGKTLAWITRFINRIVHPFIQREYLSEQRAQEFAREMANDLRSLPQNWRSLTKPLLFSFANKALMMSILAVTFLSFKVPFSIGTIIGGFSISYLFLIVSPTPSGIGIVEGILPLALSSLLVPWSQAVIITLAYRGITFWLPLGVGAIALRMLNQET